LFGFTFQVNRFWRLTHVTHLTNKNQSLAHVKDGYKDHS